MTGRGRPLRFVAGVLGSWTALRAFMLWPHPVLLPTPPPPVTIGVSATPIATARGANLVLPRSAEAQRAVAIWRASGRPAAFTAAARVFATATRVLPGRPGDAIAAESVPGPAAALTPQRFAPHRAKRLSASLWLVARGAGGGAASLDGPELGGSQAGLRIAYALDERHHLAIAARIATPLADPGREAALGIEWQPFKAPIRFVAEHRFALDGGHGGPSVGAIGGFGPVAVGGGIRVDGYGQAGVVFRDRANGFADAAVHANRSVAKIGAVTLDLGLGVWGGIQPSARRLDAGPVLGLAVPVEHHPFRVTVEWRQRLAGNARPASGPALTLGSDF